MKSLASDDRAVAPHPEQEEERLVYFSINDCPRSVHDSFTAFAKYYCGGKYSSAIRLLLDCFQNQSVLGSLAHRLELHINDAIAHTVKKEESRPLIKTMGGSIKLREESK